jgi:NitT/TauT family transport system ATP-binding protein
MTMLVPLPMDFEDEAPVREESASASVHYLSALSFRDATIEFGPVKAVDGVTLDVRPGEFLCIVGPSGCGKTTLLNYAAGLLPSQVLTGGSAQVLGEQPREGHERLAYMLARDSLLPWRTALGNAEFGAEARGVPAAVRRARAVKLLERVGLGGFADSYPKALSHGMRQRVALARTFCLDADVLLMDEPFGALDAQTKLQLEDLLLELWQETQKTVVFITHDLSEAIALGDRVIVMAPRPGRIIAEVPIQLARPRKIGALQKDPAYHEYYARIWTTLEEGFVA